MKLWGLWAATGLYAWTAVELVIARNYPMALAFACYGLANVGLILSILAAK